MISCDFARGTLVRVRLCLPAWGGEEQVIFGSVFCVCAPDEDGYRDCVVRLLSGSYLRFPLESVERVKLGEFLAEVGRLKDLGFEIRPPSSLELAMAGMVLG